MKYLRELLASMRLPPFPSAEEQALQGASPGERHRYALEHLCAKNPRRNAARRLFRSLRRDGVRVRRPADLRPHFAALFSRLNLALNRPVVIENEGTVQE